MSRIFTRDSSCFVFYISTVISDFPQTRMEYFRCTILNRTEENVFPDRESNPGRGGESAES